MEKKGIVYHVYICLVEENKTKNNNYNKFACQTTSQLVLTKVDKLSPEAVKQAIGVLEKRVRNTKGVAASPCVLVCCFSFRLVVVAVVVYIYIIV
jgi:CRISPR/Cas system CMR-associated protein Cmr3 (group 5 of RAMP superfamily)